MKDVKHQVEPYHTLNVLLEEPDKDTFMNQMDAFITLWKSTEPDFIKYFNTIIHCSDYPNGHICKHVHAVHIHIEASASAHVESSHTRITDNSGTLTCTPTPSEKENVLPVTRIMLHTLTCTRTCTSIIHMYIHYFNSLRVIAI